MTSPQEERKPHARSPDQSRRNRNLLLAGLVVALLLFIVLMNFVPLYAATSRTETNATMEVGRSGGSLPPNMEPGFTLLFQVEGPPELAEAVSKELPGALAETSMGEATAVPDLNAAGGPRLLITLDIEDRLWTPVYGHAQVTARITLANVADVPWPQDEPMILTESPEIQAKGEITVKDTTWGLVSKPAYTRLLGQALAEGIGAKLQNDVFQTRR